MLLLFLETIFIKSFFLVFNFSFRSFFYIFQVNFILFVNSIYNKVMILLGVDRDCSLFFNEFLNFWCLNLFFFILLSLVIFINEEFDTSLTELFFESSFLTWVIFYFPDFLIFGFSVFINKIIFVYSNGMQFILPFLEVFSSVLKSFVLSIRINTNYISGHLLLTFLCVMFNYFYLVGFIFFLFFYIILFNFLFFLEVFIVILQLYVLVILTSIYIKELQF